MAAIENVDLSKLGKHELKSLPGGEIVQMESLWKDKTCVIIFFRRWGCLFCRLWAKELSEMAPVLKENNIRFVGIGVEELGAEEFVNGKFFDGELYVDKNRTVYKELKFKRFNWVSILMSLFSSESRAAVQKGRSLNLGGDYRGDGLQNGGALVVAAGGEKVLLSFHQERPAEHLPNSKFLEALGLTEKATAEKDTEKKEQQ